jgi:F420-dependent oxidoreductase-like protein
VRIGVLSGATGQGGIDDLVGEAQRAEAQGFAFFGAANIFGLDAISALAIAGRETRRIELATGVVPTPPRHPQALAQQALTAAAASRGRFTLGIGLSHRIVIESMLGLSYAKPALQMREYLSVLAPLLRGEVVDFDGALYRVHNTQLQVPGAGAVPVLVAALGPRLLEVTGELADGTITWMTGPRTLAAHTVPVLGKAAAAAGRPAPRVVAGFPIALTRDAAKARERAGQVFQIYGQLPSYRAMLDREGAAGPADVALVGDEAALRAELRRLREAGVTDFAASCFPADEGSVPRTIEFLRSEL